MNPDYRPIYPDENIVRFLVSSFPKSRRSRYRILDLGCGIGRHIILLRQMGFKAYGIDGSIVAVKYAENWLKREKCEADIRLGPITSLPYVDNFFDGIIEHATLVNNSWEDILKASKECYRVLKKGGVGFFLLKRITDCAFDHAKKIGENTYLVKDSIFLSQKTGTHSVTLPFHAFTKSDISAMFLPFGTVRIHTWDMSFKKLTIDEVPGKRKTSYYIVLVEK
ncbi:class I SAM-dependent methyltransferase [Candidatus Gottesmanbacteria bacterium]|nr:class I SAM-dependent methyltransferase [Candidatus Gottesmanbacteria bacterium]